MFSKILIANRGEIAVRIIRACKEMGVATVAVYSEADKNSLHVALADQSYCIGGPEASESYLNENQIISTAVLSGAQAVHPGYGFLSENAHFAEICKSCNIHFIGPTPEQMRAMGDKAMARDTMRNAGVPVTPGSNGIIETEEDALAVAEKYCQNKDVVSNIKKVLEFANSISDGKFDAVYDKSLVRGMGYYTGMVFEIASHKFGSSVAGGGRYDEMIGKFLGESVPAVGFSIGFERICAILLDEGFTPPLNKKIVLAYNDDDSFAEVSKKAKELQSNGKIVMMLKRSKKFGKQLDALIENEYSQMINFVDGSVKELSK
jgi:hypothetical protein